MGGSQSRSMEVLRYFEKEWEYIRSNQHAVKIYRNRDNDHQAEEHHLVIDPKTNLLKQYDIYNYRRVQDTALVSVYAVQNMKDNKPNLCGNRDCLRVLTQSIPIRGSSLNNLQFNQGLYMLSECLRGFDDCYSKVGGFQISQNMMGLNNRGHVKVWLNQNYEQNHPPHQRPMLQITTANIFRTKASQQQLQMVEKVTDMVQSKCKGGFPDTFKNIIKKECNFVDAYNTIEEYAKKYEVDIPDRIVINNVQNYYHQPFAPKNNQPRNRNVEVNQPQRMIKSNKGNFQNDNFSFKDYTHTNTRPQEVNHKQIPSFLVQQNLHSQQRQSDLRSTALNFNQSRQTLINRLPRDTLVSKYQQREVRNTNNRTNIFQKQYQSATPIINATVTKRELYQPPDLPRYESTYQYQPKISVKNMSQQVNNSTMVRGTSPNSPRGINFSYQSNQVQRQTSPVRTNFVTSQRF